MIMRTTPLGDISNLSVTEFLISFLLVLSPTFLDLLLIVTNQAKKGKCKALSMSPKKNPEADIGIKQLKNYFTFIYHSITDDQFTIMRF